jgi:hypothetical protein
MGNCTNCGGYLPPVQLEVHVGEYTSTHFESAQVTCFNCNIIYMIDNSLPPPKDEEQEEAT